MQPLDIVKLPETILRRKSKNVDPASIKNSETKKLLKRMFLTMKAANGIGLAAPQIGKNINLFIMDKELAKISEMPAVFFNAKITERSKEEEIMEEGCLSVFGETGMIRRASKIKISATNDRGKEFTMEIHGLPARVLQHEMDHILGILIVDKMIKTGSHPIA